MSHYKNMQKLDVAIEVPFEENRGRRCVPACAAMILRTLLPEKPFTNKVVEDLCGFREGQATWATQHLLSLHSLGMRVGWVQDEDLKSFASDPFTYIAQQIPDSAEYAAFTAVNDLGLEAERVKSYFDLGLPFEQRQGTADDITDHLVHGGLVRLEVNGKILANKEGYANHAVVVSGFNDNIVRLENPDGLYGSKPKQIVPWTTLDKAWEGGTMQYYYREL